MKKWSTETKVLLQGGTILLVGSLATRWVYDYIFDKDQDVFLLSRGVLAINKGSILIGLAGCAVMFVLLAIMLMYNLRNHKETE